VVDQLFWFCVSTIKTIGEVTGMGYNLTNLVLFVFLQPVLIVLFFTLWRLEVGKRSR